VQSALEHTYSKRLHSNVIGWCASHPAEPINGNVIANAFGGVRFDPEKGWTFPKGAIHPAERGNTRFTNRTRRLTASRRRMALIFAA
jgi:hypothetical protein